MHHVKKILRDMRDNDRYYQEHFEIIKQMPFVKDLINENNKLRETLKTFHKEDNPKLAKSIWKYLRRIREYYRR